MITARQPEKAETGHKGRQQESAPTLSVILPNYNHAQYIDDAVGAILAQSLPPAQLIIVDDGSTDGSTEKLRALAAENECIVLLENEVNKGTNHSVLRGQAVADGEYIFFAAMDDPVGPGFFEKSVTLLARNPDAAFCTALSKMITEDGIPFGTSPSPPIETADGFLSPARAREAMMRHGTWFGNTAIYRRETIKAAGWFDSRLGPFADGFILMMLALRQGCCFIPEVLSSVRVSDSNQSAQYVTDLNLAAPMFETAKRLMETEYAGLFPPALVSRWEDRWKLAVAQNIFAGRGAEGLPAVRRLMQDKSSLHGMALGLAGLAPGFARIWLPRYLALAFTPYDVATSLRRRLTG